MRPFPPIAIALMLALLAACAPVQRPIVKSPAPTSPATISPATSALSSDFHAVFGPQGVAWVSAGRACVARAPAYTVTCPRLGARAVDVAWHDADAWAALPQLGLVLTLDRAARSVNAGAVARLSSQLIYREDGTALTYAGSPGGQVAGAPGRAITGGDGVDYVILAGQLRRVADSALIDAAPRPELVSTPAGVQSVLVPTLVTETGSYRISAGQLERLDTAGLVTQHVAHEAAQLGLVGDDLVTLTPAGRLRHFSASLQELALP